MASLIGDNEEWQRFYAQVRAEGSSQYAMHGEGAALDVPAPRPPVSSVS